MLALGAVALISFAPAAHAARTGDSGGSSYPAPAEGTSPSTTAPGSQPAGAGSGGTPSARRPDRPVVQVKVSRGVVASSGRSAVRVGYRVADSSRRTRVTIAFVRPTGKVVLRARVGWKRTNVDHTYSWATSQELRLIPEPSYRVRVSARDPRGNRATRTATVTRTDAPPTTPNASGHVFPVQGPHSFGGEDARFGAPRRGHTHQGQDITAAAGTPVVAPTAGTISWRGYQAGGAGNYLVLDASTEDYDYVFMHLSDGSLLVSKGSQVTAGQRIASVGSTGESTGPHLHFEAWQGPWYDGGAPVDPLPMLLTWAGA